MQSNSRDLEDILAKFNIFGLYHLKFWVLFCFVSMTNMWYSSNYIFAAADVQYWCKYECENNNDFVTTIRDNDNYKAKCSKYILNGSDTCNIENVMNSSIVDCNQWTYDEPDSLVEEFQLECQDWKRTLPGTVHSIGYMCGLLIVGPLSDKFGRKIIIITYGTIGAVMGLLRSVTNSIIIYVILEFVEASIGDPFSPMFTLAIEIISKEKRLFLIGLTSFTFAVATTFMGTIAWAVPYWRNFLRAIYAPSLLFLMFTFTMDESIRWLLTKNRKKEAIDILRKAAIMNKLDISETELNNITYEKQDEKPLCELLKITVTSKQMLLRVLSCIFMWITVTYNSYAVLIGSVRLYGDRYVNFGMVALGLMPAGLALMFLPRHWKRKLTLIISLIFTGLFFIAQLFIPPENFWLSTTLYYVGAFFDSIAFQSVYLYTSELFPTYTRNTMHAFCSSIGRIGSTLSQQTPLMVKYWSGLPSVLICVLSLLTAFTITLIPDTSNKNLPDTVEQAEAIGHNNEINISDSL